MEMLELESFADEDGGPSDADESKETRGCRLVANSKEADCHGR
jgi:hypothetical protein